MSSHVDTGQEHLQLAANQEHIATDHIISAHDQNNRFIQLLLDIINLGREKL